MAVFTFPKMPANSKGKDYNTMANKYHIVSGAKIFYVVNKNNVMFIESKLF